MRWKQRTQLELQQKLELTKLEAEKKVVATRDQAELAKLEAFRAEREMSELAHDQGGIKWSPKVEESRPTDNLMQSHEVPVVSLPSAVTSTFTPVSMSVTNPPFTSTPAVAVLIAKINPSHNRRPWTLFAHMTSRNT